MLMKYLSIVSVTLSLLLASRAQAQVLLEFVNPSNGSNTETITDTAGSTFTVDIGVADSSATHSLAGFDLTLSALPDGIALSSFTQVLPNFTPNTSSPNTLYYSADDNSSSQDIALGATPVDILQANFTLTSPLSPGSYNLNFTNPGIFQGLYDGEGNDISYTGQQLSLKIQAVPEPSVLALSLTTGFAFAFIARLVSLTFHRRI